MLQSILNMTGDFCKPDHGSDTGFYVFWWENSIQVGVGFKRWGKKDRLDGVIHNRFSVL